VQSASFSPDGQRIVTASHDMTARIWDAATGKSIAALEGHIRAVHSAAFSPDGQRIVTASEDNTAHIWDVSRIETIIRFRTIVLAAALTHGIGWRTDRERSDLLMQDAEDDLYAEALQQLGRTPNDPEIADAAAALAASLHPNCYLSPSQFAFAAARTGGVSRGEAAIPVPARTKPSGDRAGVAGQPDRHWGRWLLLTLLVLVIAGLAALIASGRIDVAEIDQLLRQVWQR
jgi:hypothetical protein